MKIIKDLFYVLSLIFTLGLGIVIGHKKTIEGTFNTPGIKCTKLTAQKEVAAARKCVKSLSLECE